MSENGGSSHNFGSCCDELKEALSSTDFDPLITVGEDDVLYMSVGLIELEDDETSIVDHPIFFCPFCGTKLQSAEDVKMKAKGDDEDAGA